MEGCERKSFGRQRGSWVGQHRRLLMLPLLISLMMLGSTSFSWALQRHTFLPKEGGKSGAGAQQPASSQAQEAGQEGKGGAVPQPEQPAHAPSPPADSQPAPHAPSPKQDEGVKPPPSTPEASASPGGSAKSAPQASPTPLEGLQPDTSQSDHGPTSDVLRKRKPGEIHEDHKRQVQLPEISPVPGVTFVETMINLMDYELNGRTFGWRPNDLILGRFLTDDINNYQLGALEAMRFTTQALKVNLTRMGDADAYDKNLEQALNLFMHKATLFWFPSAESSYGEGIENLKIFLGKLNAGNRSFYYRVDNLLTLLTYYKDLLGNVNKGLIVSNYADGTPVSWFYCDDHFYYSKGIAHVMYETLRVVRVGFQTQLVTLDAVDIMDEILHELQRVETMNPWIIMNSDLDGFFANHRANLNAPLSEVTHMLGVIVQLGNQIRH